MSDTAPSHGHWFEGLADHLGQAYLRYSFTKGTAQEVAFLAKTLGLEPGMKVLDVGCGPGRHSNALGELGIEATGIDISQRFIDIARANAAPGVTFRRADARHLDYDGQFDAVISLCQGAFGLADGGRSDGSYGDTPLDPDGEVLYGIARAAKPGGLVALSAFSAYFQVRWLDPERGSFDAERGVNYERTEIKNEAGVASEADLWTTCFTPRELRLMAQRSGLEVEHLWSVRPGEYGPNPPDIDHEEFLLVARRPLEPAGDRPR